MSHITITPAAHHRVSFARWATSQTERVRTNGHDSFAVPAHLFGDIPAALLNGSLLDGQPYVTPRKKKSPKAAAHPVTVSYVSAPETVGDADSADNDESVTVEEQE